MRYTIHVWYIATHLKAVILASGLWREHHDQVASFMAAMGARGAEEALRLSGLSLRQELRLASGVGQLRRAQHCLEALAWGSGDRATLNAFPLWQSHTIDTLLGGGSGGVYSLSEHLLHRWGPPSLTPPPPPPPTHTHTHTHTHISLSLSLSLSPRASSSKRDSQSLSDHDIVPVWMTGHNNPCSE